MPDLLIELFSEEIPARMQGRAADDLKRLVTTGLVEAGLTYSSAGAFATPRRLALTIAEHQAIFDGILAQSETRAIRAMRAHIDAVMVELFAFAREHPDLFADGMTLGTDSDSFPFG